MAVRVEIAISDFRILLNGIDKRLVQDCPVIHVMRHGKAAFCITSVDWLEAVEETLEIMSDPEAMKMLQQSLQDIREGRLIEHEDVLASV